MLDTDTKRRIDTARDILVGKVPDPKSQVEQITIALIYKFMDDMDAEAAELGGKRKFFTGEFAAYGWAQLMKKAGNDKLLCYAEGITKMTENEKLPELFRSIFKNAYLPYRDPETLNAFLKIIDEFSYDHSERLGDAFEYLLSVLGSQGDAGQFRTPRHIIDFMVEVLAPQKHETILDPACGTAGFLISAYKHILRSNDPSHPSNQPDPSDPAKRPVKPLTPDEKGRLAKNFKGYDISPDMVRLSLVNLYLHGFTDPHIYEYDSLTSEERWNEFADVILANPPFMSPKGGIKPHKRFSIQAKRSEVLFVDYMAEHLTPTGRAAIIVPEGIIFQSQTAYKELRKMLVENSLVAVVSLPAGCFNPYSGVKCSILILDKSIARQSDTIAFFKVENDGFGLGAQRRAIEKNDLPQVQAELAAYLDALRGARALLPASSDSGQECRACETGAANPPSPSTAQIVPKEKIAANGDYNLSGERYREGAAQSQTYPSYPLSEVCDIFNGSTPSKQEPRYWENGTVPWFTIDDIRKGGRIIEKTEKFVTDAGLKETSLKLLPKHSVLLCCTASVGEYAFTEIEVTTNQQFNGLVVNRAFADQLQPKYLFLISSRFKDELIRLSGKTSFNFVSVGTLKTIEIPLPPLEVQKEIVAEIENYQKVINGARAVLDHYRPHIPIHPDWPMVEFDEVVFFQEGPGIRNWQFTSSGIKLLNVKNIVGDRVILDNSDKHISEEEFAAKYSHFLVEDGDIILASSGATYGKNAFFKDPGFRVMVNTSNIRLHQKDEGRIIQGYIKVFLDSPLFKAQIDRLITGAAQPNFGPSHLKQVKIPLPPLATQQAIVAEIEAEQALVAANRELITRFEQKIQATLARIWGEETAATPEA